MPGTMSQADLISDLKGILQDAAEKFLDTGDEDFIRHLTIAAHDLGRFRRRTLLGEITLQAGVSDYDAPANFHAYKYSLWGIAERRTRKPWAQNYPLNLPRLSSYEGAGGMKLHLEPAPGADQVADLGASYKYYYYAGHVVSASAANTTVRPEDRALLLIRASAQALTELAHQGVTKPYTLGSGSGGVGSMPKNGTPGALANDLLKLFETMGAADR